jgi:hypothetical protein
MFAFRHGVDHPFIRVIILSDTIEKIDAKRGLWIVIGLEWEKVIGLQDVSPCTFCRDMTVAVA